MSPLLGVAGPMSVFLSGTGRTWHCLHLCNLRDRTDDRYTSPMFQVAF